MKPIYFWAGVPVLLTLLFIHHKMAGNIDWSWMWITSALWGPLLAWFVFWTAIDFAAGFVRGFRRSYKAERDARRGGGSKV